MVAAPTNIQKYIAEFIGTYLLVFTVGCNVLLAKDPVASNWSVTSIACVLMVCIYALGGVSGANFNPAVSVSLGLKGALPWKEVAIYAVVQIVAGILAGFSYNAAFAVAGQPVLALGPKPTFGAFEVMLAETLYTCMLCFVVLNVATVPKHAGNEYFGLAIGFVIIAGGYAAGGISGGAFNPAVALGIEVSSKQFGWGVYYLMYELIGSALAVALFKVVRPDESASETTTSSKLVSEFVGTFYLCLTVGLCVLGKSPATPWSAAAALMCMIYSLGSVSGANFNPAVTTALLLRGGGVMQAAQAGMYIVVQIVAGVVGNYVSSLMHHKETFGFSAGSYGWGAVSVAEIAFTFVLCFTVLCVCTSGKAPDHIFGLAIGSCITVGGFAIGNVSGGALNPAVSLGATIVDMKQGATVGLTFAAVELVGGALAAVAWKATHTDEEKQAI